MPWVRRHWWGKERLYLCAGGVDDPSATKVDVKPEVNPTVVCDAQHTPFAAASFDWIMIDPPYSTEEAKRLYGLDECPSASRLVLEAARLCKPGGHILLLHRQVITLTPGGRRRGGKHSLGLTCAALYGIVKQGTHNDIRALTVWRRNGSMKNFIEEAK